MAAEWVMPEQPRKPHQGLLDDALFDIQSQLASAPAESAPATGEATNILNLLA